MSGQNLATDFAETDAETSAWPPAGDRKSIAVFEPFALFAAREFKRIRAAPGQLKQAPPRVFRFAADCSAREQIARLQITTADRVMRKLLRDGPVKVQEIRSRDRLRRLHLC